MDLHRYEPVDPTRLNLGGLVEAVEVLNAQVDELVSRYTEAQESAMRWRGYLGELMAAWEASHGRVAEMTPESGREVLAYLFKELHEIAAAAARSAH
jgi:hypothetical protein